MDGVTMRPVYKSDRFIDPNAAGIIIDPDHVPSYESTFYKTFDQVTVRHGRSLTGPNQHVLRNQPITDEFGNIYSAYSIKGAGMGITEATYNDIEPSKVRVNGHLDASTFQRCREVSTIFRGAGILTEWPIYHARPMSHPRDEEDDNDIDLAGFKAQILSNYHETQDYRQKYYASGDKPEVRAEVELGLKGLRFAVMYRAMMSNARLWDIEMLQSNGMLGTHVTEAIHALHARKPDQFKVWPDIAALDPERPADHVTYMGEILPELIGENLGLIHSEGELDKKGRPLRLGSLLVYPHGGNWTFAGEAVDLDAVLNAHVNAQDAEEINTMARIGEAHSVTATVINELGQFKRGKEGEIVNRYAYAYYKTRQDAPRVSEFEDVILESQLLPKEKMDLDTLGEPRIVEFTQTDIDQVVTQGLLSAEGSNPGNEPYAFSNTVDLCLREVARPQVIAYLEESEIGADLEELERTTRVTSRLVDLEVMKQIMIFRNHLVVVNEDGVEI